MGYPDGTFRPAKGLTRAEASVVAARLLGIAGKEALLLAPRPAVPWRGGDLVVLGAAAAFEGTVNFRVKGEDGTVLLESYTASTNGTGWGVVKSQIYCKNKLGPKVVAIY